MKRFLLVVCLLVLACAPAIADDTGYVMLPNTDTAVGSSVGTKYIYNLFFQLVSGTSGTVTFKSITNSCNGGPCTVVIAFTTANQNAGGSLGGVPMPGGFTWSASCSNCIEGWVRFSNN